MNLIELIQQTNLQIDKEIGEQHKVDNERDKESIARSISDINIDEKTGARRIRYGGKDFTFVMARKFNKAIQEAPIAEYCCVYLSDSDFKIIMPNCDIKEFVEFQTSLLSRRFFQYTDDRRWNLYLIIIVDEESNLWADFPLGDIENDENYARKHILTAKKIPLFFQKEWMIDESAAIGASDLPRDPLRIWEETLHSCNLTGCLDTSVNFATDPVDKYIDKGIPFLSTEINRKTVTLQKRRTATDFLTSIKKIQLGKFRPCCFTDPGTQLHPGQVNLLFGANGSGKTTILEGIEYALTNKIKRLLDAGQELPEGEGVSVSCSKMDRAAKKLRGKIIVRFEDFEPIQGTEKVQFARAQDWYAVPPGNRKKSDLNEQFNRYNAFNSDAAYRFTIDSVDYKKSLSNLVYGNELLERQELWNRYKKEFNNRLLGLEKDKKSKHKQLLSLKKETKTIFSPQEIYNDLKIKQPMLLNSADDLKKFRALMEFLEATNLVISAPYYSGNTVSQTLTLKEVGEWVDELDQQLQKHNLAIANIEKNVSKLRADRTKFVERLRLLSNDKNAAEAKLTRLVQTEGVWNQIKNVAMNQDKVADYAQLDHNIADASTRLDQIHTLLRKWPELNSLVEENLAICDEITLERKRKQLRDAQIAQSQAVAKIKQLTETMSAKKQAIVELQKLGTKIIELDLQIEPVCPLCKKKHKSKIALLNAIMENVDIGVDEKELQILHGDKETSEFSIALLKGQLSLDEENKKSVNYIHAAYMYLARTYVSSLNLDASPIDMLSSLKTFINKKIEIETDFKKNKDELSQLIQIGITLEGIDRYNSFVSMDEEYIRFIAESKGQSFEQYLRQQKNEWNIKLEESIVKIGAENDEITALDGRISCLTTEEAVKAKQATETELIVASDLTKRIILLRDNFELNDAATVDDLTNSIKGSRAKCLIAISTLEKDAERKKTEYEIKSIDEKILRCKTATAALKTLPELSKFAEAFIDRNIEKINRFFCLLHMPQEFDSIRLTSNGLEVRRVVTNKWDTASNMSSGQRASFALAVLFTLHIAAQKAPKFILLDEPVANMDDMHLLNLIEVIRDLALEGRQIFFSTANPNVANIFRRKFSFMQDEFKCFSLKRNGNEPVEITEMSFLPGKEEPVKKRIAG